RDRVAATPQSLLLDDRGFAAKHGLRSPCPPCLRGESSLARARIDRAVITLIPWSSGLKTQADHFGNLVAVSDGEHELTHRALGAETIAVEEVPEEPGDLARLPPAPAQVWGRIIFTSGTTGRPKAIVHTHEARWIANLLQRATLPYAPAPGTRALLMTPFTHGASLI